MKKVPVKCVCSCHLHPIVYACNCDTIVYRFLLGYQLAKYFKPKFAVNTNNKQECGLLVRPTRYAPARL